MIRQNQKLINLINASLDAVLILVAHLLASWLRLCFMEGRLQAVELIFTPTTLFTGILYASACIAMYAFFGMYGSFRFRNFRREVVGLAVANFVSTILTVTVLYLLHQDEFSRLRLGYFFLFSTLFVVLKRLVLRAILSHYRTLGYNTRSLVLLGEGELARRYYEKIRGNPRFGYRYLGYVGIRPDRELGGHLCDYGEFSAWLSRNDLDEAVMVLDQDNTTLVGSVIASCGRYGVKVSVIPSYNDFIASRPTVEMLDDLKLITVRRAPRSNPVWRFVKRSMDVTGALVGLVLTSPVMLVTAIAIRCDSPGPVIFRQKRVGLNGREFYMYKFRSMRQDAEQQRAALEKLNEADGPVFKIANDPRITRVGHFIRKTSIDELPQLWNILRGDMSMVGPRPPLPDEVAQYSDFEWGRLTVRPGLTCYWQIGGRSDISFDEWMKLDMKYIEDQCLSTDLRILWKTVWVVLKGSGAY